MEEDENIETAIRRIDNLLIDLSIKLEEMIPHSSFPITRILDDIRAFRILGSVRLETSPIKRYAREIKLRNSRKSLRKLTEEAKELQDALEEERLTTRRNLEKIMLEIDAERRVIANDTEAASTEAERLECEKLKNESTKTTKECYEMRNSLSREISLIKSEIEDMKKTYAANERELRILRRNVESRYIDLVNSYDKEISASYGTLLRLTALLTTMEEEQRELEHRMIDHRALYSELKAERELALQKAHVERLENFRRNRAAAIIQRSWRIYYERVCLKRRKKQRKKRA